LKKGDLITKRPAPKGPKDEPDTVVVIGGLLLANPYHKVLDILGNLI